jgi:simple sugar transport system ATP-binding protein
LPLLAARQLRKQYGLVTALAGVDIDVRAGEVVALVGDNGAGKSTLVKILSGALSPTSGTMMMAGTEVVFSSPREAAAHGIQTVYQDLALAGDLSIASNIYLGREVLRPGLLGRLGFLDNRAMRRGTEETLERLMIRLKSPDTDVRALSGGQRQSVAIARALAWASKIVFLDEPTAALGVAQTHQLLELVRRVRSLGLGIVFISHNMQDVLSIADRVVVLRLGAKAAEFTAGNFTVDQLVAAITGSDRAVTAA